MRAVPEVLPLIQLVLGNGDVRGTTPDVGRSTTNASFCMELLGQKDRPACIRCQVFLSQSSQCKKLFQQIQPAPYCIHVIRLRSMRHSLVFCYRAVFRPKGQPMSACFLEMPAVSSAIYQGPLLKHSWISKYRHLYK